MDMTSAKYIKSIEKIIAEHQRVQMVNPPTSKKWLAASREINRLASLITSTATLAGKA